MEFVGLFEASLSALALILTFFNYLISLRLKSIETRIEKLEIFEKSALKNFEILHKISGQIEILIKELNTFRRVK